MALFKLSSKINRNHQQSSSLGRVNKLMVCTIAILIVFEALVTNAKASNGSKLAQLQAEHQSLNAEVLSLELEISSYASLSHIKSYATQDLGMKPVDKNILYLPLSEPSQP